MVEPLADLIVNSLKLVDVVLSIWVDLEAAEPLRTYGTYYLIGPDFVNALAEVAVGLVDMMAQLVLNMTI